MQLYALEGDSPILASRAEKSKDYLCPECQGRLRVRGGHGRQIHFYHLATPRLCRQHQKGADHLHLQLRLLELIGEGAAQIESPFPAIGRIADVAWPAQKIVYEVQCSPISLEEARQRTADYRTLGYEVVWILHDKRFNQKKLSPAEKFLRETSCYFTNIDRLGQGIVYDQFDHVRSYKRFFKGEKLVVSPTRLFPIQRSDLATTLPKAVADRLAAWKYFAAGDLLDRLMREGNLSGAARQMLFIEGRGKGEAKKERLPLKTLLSRAYRSAIDLLIGKI